jgi:hypothetical protein
MCEEPEIAVQRPLGLPERTWPGCGVGYMPRSMLFVKGEAWCHFTSHGLSDNVVSRRRRR